ncbi:alpha/beta fold hydrolase [Tenacibaculum finnmarkense]|uniref:alpha/beta fold hydrolase n=1 Tax=Tenacibaculum finnmarkense TaxID=2781243 RepID=UPI001E442370|nr:alpha/beta hydrolase [Tenacibaculum finnmarkense]MCD8399024.1 alpha/beta hydrolase [Tenacibaculum finnmarkense genomovar ulcerans]MCD8421920.1 alpha/beta hydrolase [Tenacibaculum finnmarkense genomovar ulcerans]MCG8238047.1 alpha/beta hydrolase [Tenacibaculum finnmarkense genomovar ulcerans]MCG8784502.1 alpha/beta hydrolase [Tenacibaculum finnmarkense]MCG8811806.1 alpha/beta hydrolase [Tenacibaculum finnmarkense]
MKKSILLNFSFLFLLFQISISTAQENFKTPYGNNKKAGEFVKINGTKIYYETYGKGEPLLIIHSCGTDIKAMEYQIDYFKAHYRVITADSRGQGKSKLKTKKLTYDLMAEDWEELAKHLKLDSVNILGWSDGGIIGLKMGIRNKIKIKKIVTMGVNLRLDPTAVNKWAIQQVVDMHSQTIKMLKKGDTSKDWEKELQLDRLLLNQPNISHADLKKVTAEVLVTIGDRDIIKNEHAVEIFNNLPKAQLCIMPGANHGIPRNNATFFNEIAFKFLSNTFNYSMDK